MGGRGGALERCVRGGARTGFVALCAVLFAPAVTWAQSSVVGTVRDTSGAVLPGATVEASSPALIEKVRTVVTDDRGLYRIVDLRPGTYALTFTLAGFTTVKREGIELPASFTATVNAEMRVGGVAETITVSGQAPLLDVQSAVTRTVLSDATMNDLPTNRTPQIYVLNLPGVAGAFPGSIARDIKQLTIHGSRNDEMVVAYAGLPTHNGRGPGGNFDNHFANLANIEELVVETGGSSAEQTTGGIYANVIPKEGGNTVSGFFYGSYSGEHLQADNLRDDLRALGLNTATSNKSLWDANAALGGRIVRDQLWFYSSVRHTGSIQYTSQLFYNKAPRAWRPVLDESRKGFVKITDQDWATRLTWQVTPKNKISAYFDQQPHTRAQRAPPSNASLYTMEAVPSAFSRPNVLTQVLWRSAVSSRFLVEAGAMTNVNDFNHRRQPEVGYDILSATEATLNLTFRAAPVGGEGYLHTYHHTYNYRAAASYVSGRHAFKSGVTLLRYNGVVQNEPNGDLGVTLRNWAPISLRQAATPNRVESQTNADIGVFAQDQWTIGPLTLNLGVRYDYLNVMAVAQKLPAGQFVGARDFPEVRDVPNWHDISPRLAIAYDLFGDGKTALKAYVNRYVQGMGTGIAVANNPVTKDITEVTRTWRDANSDFVPDCDLRNPLENGECGQISNLNFGRANPRATRYDDDVLHGFGKRGYNWETSLAVQRELLTGFLVNVGYYRRSYGNKTVTDNLEVTPADYDPYCVTVPVDPRLPGGGGNQLCGFADISRAKFGRSQNFITFANHYGTPTEIYQGVDATVAMRFPGGTQISGGLSTGRTATNSCFVIDSPQALQFCDNTPPFRAQYKFSGVYRLPWWDLQTSGTFYSFPGSPLAATYVFTNAEIKPTLLRDLGQGANGSVTVDLVPPSALFIERMTQLDFRLSKVLTYKKARIAANIDLFNLFNGSASQIVNTRYGPSWTVPSQSQSGRYVQFGTQLNF